MILYVYIVFLFPALVPHVLCKIENGTRKKYAWTEINEKREIEPCKITFTDTHISHSNSSSSRSNNEKKRLCIERMLTFKHTNENPIGFLSRSLGEKMRKAKGIEEGLMRMYKCSSFVVAVVVASSKRIIRVKKWATKMWAREREREREMMIKI